MLCYKHNILFARFEWPLEDIAIIVINLNTLFKIQNRSDIEEKPWVRRRSSKSATEYSLLLKKTATIKKNKKKTLNPLNLMSKLYESYPVITTLVRK